MTTIEILRLVFEFLLSGTLIVTLVTLRATRRKAQEDARRVAIDNDKELMSNFHEFIVEPLKKEVNGLRKDVRRFSRAVEKINECPTAARCPVRLELQKPEEQPDTDDRQQNQ